MIRKRNLRKKVLEESEEEDQDLLSKINETRTIQQLRKRQAGFAITSDKYTQNEHDSYDNIEGANALGTFSASSLKQDDDVTDDPHMQKYIEEQLALRLGKRSVATHEEDPLDKQMKAEQALYEIPEELKSKAVTPDDATVVGMTSTLSEVLLPDESRMRNIQAVEAVKRAMLAGAGVRSVVGEEEDERRGRRQDALRRSHFVSSFGSAGPTQRKKPRLPPDEHRQRLESQQKVVRAPKYGP